MEDRPANTIPLPGTRWEVDHGDFRRAALVGRDVLQDADLSTDARLVYALCCTFPHGWKLRHADLRERTGWGKYRLTGAIRALREAGIVGEVRARDEAGRVSGRTLVFFATPSRLPDKFQNVNEK